MATPGLAIRSRLPIAAFCGTTFGGTTGGGGGSISGLPSSILFADQRRKVKNRQLLVVNYIDESISELI